MKEPISLSIFELFKIGPGPSSSHTIAPMRAAADFVKSIQELPEETESSVDKLEVHLFGSLSATGKGHATDFAVTAGLIGQAPDTCDPDIIEKLRKAGDKPYSMKIGQSQVNFTPKDIIFDAVEHSFPFQNTLIFRLLSKGKPVFEKEYYSTGGGFIKWKGQGDQGGASPVHKYSNMKEFIALCEDKKKDLVAVMLENEQAVSGLKKEAIEKKLDTIIDVMLDSVDRGLKSEGTLDGPLGLQKKAKSLYSRHNAPEHLPGSFIALLSSFAIAAAEENASYHKVVTAPTLGSAGVIPAALYAAHHHFKISRKKLREAMLAAALIGFICKQNASLAGAEVGCQGEIGVATAMAAALAAYTNNHDIHVIANAAEIALEHCLGWTCDPVGGYVQIPCIERNAIGAVHAFNAYILATAGDPKKQRVGFDETVEAMLETGKDMCGKYKETSLGGLAVCVAVPNC